VTPALTSEQRAALVSVLMHRPEVVRAIFSGDRPKPTPAFEYDDRSASVVDAQRMVQELVAAVAPALGYTARELGFAAGGPDEIAMFADGGEVVYERS
jgi:alpha-galactosidase/6-phospho-beta-glucosidase family protein